ncbi:hypothetical protein N9B82_03165 [Saprospiraceae bacterium]|nr:hypothetical protein [Saprospiraceae bacterium]
MSVTPVSPYGKKLVAEKGKVIEWSGRNAKRSLFHSLVAELLKQQKEISVFITDDESDLWSDLSAHLISRDNPQFGKLVHDFAREHLDDNSSYHRIKEAYFHEQGLVKRGDFYHEVIFGTQCLAEISEKYIEASAKVSADDLLSSLHGAHFDFTFKEYEKIFACIEKAIKVYKPHYSFLDTNNLFNENVFINKEGDFSTSIILKYLTSFRSKATLLTKKFSQFISDIQTENNKLQKKNILDTTKQIILAEYDLHALATNSLSKSDYKKWTHRCNDIKEDINSAFNFDLKKAKQYNDIAVIEQTLIELGQIVKKEEKETEKRTRDFLKAVNIKSYKSEFIAQIEKEIDALIKSINDSQLFIEKLENNSISSLKQFETLKSILDKISMAQNQLMQMGDYYNWKAFLVQIPKISREVVEALKSSAVSTWQASFHSWYYFKLIEKHSTVTDDIDSGLNLNVENSSITCLDYITCNRQKSLNKLREGNPKLYNKILKKADTDLLSEKVEEERLVISAFQGFKIYTDHNLIPKDSTIIDFSGKKWDREDVYVFANQSSTIYQDSNFPMSCYVSNVLSEVSIDEKLDLSKYLASQLTKKKNHPELYLSKNANIILNISPWKKAKLLQEIDFEGLKKIRIRDKVETGITEFMLNDSELMYYIYDDLYLESQREIGYFAEQEFIQSMEKAGYTCIFLDVQKALSEDEYFIRQFSQIQL